MPIAQATGAGTKSISTTEVDPNSAYQGDDGAKLPKEISYLNGMAIQTLCTPGPIGASSSTC
jgi:hypothetical protein